MVDVTHHCDNRRARLLDTFVLRQGLFKTLLKRIGADQPDRMAELFYNQRCSILIDHLIDRRHHTELHQLLDDST